MCVGSLGLGAAYVLADSAQHNGILICHATGNPDHFVDETPDAESILHGTGHASHERDIIPPFVVIENGVRREFPGQNMDAILSGGFTGAQIWANNCVVPPVTNPVITQTVTTTETETVHVTTTVPGETVTAPGETTTKKIIIRVTTPGHTETLPGETTVVTVPTLTTTTVTLPERTVTLPSETVTERGQTVALPPVTVTVPGPTHTLTGESTTTVVTITTPGQTIGGNVNGPAHVIVRVTTPGRTVTVTRKVIRVNHVHVESEPRTVILRVNCRCPGAGGEAGAGVGKG
jgi:hypothetical protein